MSQLISQVLMSSVSGHPGGPMAPAMPPGTPYMEQFASQLGVPQHIMQQPYTQQMISQVLPQLLIALGPEGESLARRMSGPQGASVFMNQQPQEMLMNMRRAEMNQMSVNMGRLADSVGLTDFLNTTGLPGMLGMDEFTGEQVGQFVTQAMPFLDPRTQSLLDRLDPAGGMRGYSDTMYAALNSGYRDPGRRISGSDAEMFMEGFSANFRRDAMGMSILDQERTSGFNVPEMAEIFGQMRMRGLVGDPDAAMSEQAIFRRLADDPALDAEFQEELRSLADRLDAGDITTAEAMNRARDEGLFTQEAFADAREELAGEAVDTSAVEGMGRSLFEARQVFRNMSEIPELMQQLERMMGSLQGVDEAAIREGLANFQALVEISGTSAEVLAREADIIASRFGVSFERGASLAAEMGLEGRFLTSEMGMTAEEANEMRQRRMQDVGGLMGSRQAADLTVLTEMGAGEALDALRADLQSDDPETRARARNIVADRGALVSYLVEQGALGDVTEGQALDALREADHYGVSADRREAVDPTLIRETLAASAMDVMFRGMDAEREAQVTAAAQDLVGGDVSLSPEQAARLGAVLEASGRGQMSQLEASAAISQITGQDRDDIAGRLGQMRARRADLIEALGAGYLSDGELQALRADVTVDVTGGEERARESREELAEDYTERLEGAQAQTSGPAAMMAFIDQVYQEEGDVTPMQMFESGLRYLGMVQTEEAMGRVNLTSAERRQLRAAYDAIKAAQVSGDDAALRRAQAEAERTTSRIATDHGYTSENVNVAYENDEVETLSEVAASLSSRFEDVDLRSFAATYGEVENVRESLGAVRDVDAAIAELEAVPEDERTSEQHQRLSSLRENRSRLRQAARQALTQAESDMNERAGREEAARDERAREASDDSTDQGRSGGDAEGASSNEGRGTRRVRLEDATIRVEIGNQEFNGRMNSVIIIQQEAE